MRAPISWCGGCSVSRWYEYELTPALRRALLTWGSSEKLNTTTLQGLMSRHLVLYHGAGSRPVLTELGKLCRLGLRVLEAKRLGTVETT